MKKILAIFFTIILIGSCQTEIDFPELEVIINSFAPNNAQPGDTITVRGSGFLNLDNATTVKLNDLSSPLFIRNDSVAQFVVPDSAVTSIFQFISSGSVVRSQDSLIITTDTTVTPSRISITTFSPDTAKVGANVILLGGGFGFSADSISVKVNGVEAEIGLVKDQEVVIKIGEGTTTGKIEITHITRGTAISNRDLIIKEDAVTGGPWKLLRNDIQGGVNMRHGISTSAANYIISDGSFFKFDLSDYSVTALAKPPFITDFPTSFIIENKIYVASSGKWGGEGADSVYLWMYEPASNQWIQKATMPGAKRTGQFAFTHNGKGIVGGGMAEDYADFLVDAYSYEPVANKWTRIADLPGKFISATGFTVGNFGYLFDSGNRHPNSDFNLGNRDLIKYDNSQNKWIKLTTLEEGVTTAAVFIAGTRIFFLISSSTEDEGSSLFEYLETTNSWIKRTGIQNDAVISRITFSKNGRGYVLGGNIFLGPILKSATDLWEYTPE